MAKISTTAANMTCDLFFVIILCSSSYLFDQSGGWPTIRHFNKMTGKEGAPYEKKTGKPMCQELGEIQNMIAYVEEAGNTKLAESRTVEQDL